MDVWLICIYIKKRLRNQETRHLACLAFRYLFSTPTTTQLDNPTPAKVYTQQWRHDTAELSQIKKMRAAQTQNTTKHTLSC